MYGLDQIGSTSNDFIDAVLHPSVANLPAGFLALVFAVLLIAAMPKLGDLPAPGSRATIGGKHDHGVPRLTPLTRARGRTPDKMGRQRPSSSVDRAAAS